MVVGHNELQLLFATEEQLYKADVWQDGPLLQLVTVPAGVIAVGEGLVRVPLCGPVQVPAGSVQKVGVHW